MRARFVNEKVIDKDRVEVDIDYGVSTTQHSEERQGRHENDFISNEEIADNVKVAMNILTKQMVRDEFNIGERVLIKNLDSQLNIVGVPKRGGNINSISFKVITVMRHPAFRNIKDTKIIKIRDEDLKQNSYF